MAINRAPFNALVDDDGTNDTGSMWNKDKIKTVLLDPIDAELAGGIPGAVITSTTTGVQNAWAPAIGDDTLIMWGGTADLTLNGMLGNVAGRRVTIRSTSISGNVLINSNNAGAPLGQRFHNLVSSGPTPIGTGGYATYINDGNFGWILAAHEQGAWITPPYSAADYFGSPGTWTVSAVNVAQSKFRVSGRQLTMHLYLNGTVTAGNCTRLSRRLPNGYTPVAGSGTFLGPCAQMYEAGVTTLSMGLIESNYLTFIKAYDTPAYVNYNSMHTSGVVTLEIN